MRWSPHVFYLNTERRWYTAKEHIVYDFWEPIVIPEEFDFDLASIPRWLWPIIGPHELSIEAPLLHDYIYHYAGNLPGGRKISRHMCDWMFLHLMRENGVGRVKSRIAWLAVRAIGWWPWYVT